MNWKTRKDELKNAISAKRFGLVTDMDGTISPIVDVPDNARVTPENLRILEQLQKSISLVAVISGRSADDVAGKVGLPGLVYMGNHGMEMWIEGKGKITDEVGVYRDSLVAASLDIKKNMVKGMRFEDKGATLSVHYRQTGLIESAIVEMTVVMENIADKHGLILSQGRKVFEFRPPVRIDKGIAIGNLVTQYQLDSVFFLGDDTTDVSAFQVARQLRESGQCVGYGLGVKSQGTPPIVLAEADCYVEEVAGVELFLGWVSISRIASST